jgi:predicted dehydrogenase
MILHFFYNSQDNPAQMPADGVRFMEPCLKIAVNSCKIDVDFKRKKPVGSLYWELIMSDHPPIPVMFIDPDRNGLFDRLRMYIQAVPHLHAQIRSTIPANPVLGTVVVTAPETLSEEPIESLAIHAQDGGGWLHFVGPQTSQLPTLFGVRPGTVGPPCEMRVRFYDRNHPLAERLPDAVYVQGRFHPLAVESDDVRTILYADWHSEHYAVWVDRSVGRGTAACTTLSDIDHPAVIQIVYRLVCRMGGFHIPKHPIGIGILGYAPSVGQYHGRAAAQISGLELQAACDMSHDRLQQARRDFPAIRTHASAEALGEDPEVALVIIATPPNTHAHLARQMMRFGKHVVCEKPLALTSAETESMVATAQRQGVHLSCHQNRRWDVDYLAIRQVLAQGLIGDLFYLETFVGGFAHPCGYWHSDTAVSGGMAYDWGAHYIDWIIGLCGGRIHSVIGTRHKRVWYDVTNADQERIQIRFADGIEAEFIHSDIAAARKPKWYLLGTEGAIIGQWQDITEYQIDPVHYFQAHSIPATEMPPVLTVFRRQSSAGLTTIKPTLPERTLFGFHANLADHLLTGEPMLAPLADSVKVVAVLEAAARSMANNGRPEVIDA